MMRFKYTHLATWLKEQIKNVPVELHPFAATTISTRMKNSLISDITQTIGICSTYTKRALSKDGERSV